jgi:5-(carboxyamino)imidazole ribonucleotide synthase
MMLNDPAAHLCHHFTRGNITNYEDVIYFAKAVLDAVTIGIESVNADALGAIRRRKREQVYPRPNMHLRTIKKKILQKLISIKMHEVPPAILCEIHSKPHRALNELVHYFFTSCSIN